jgi:hypothetical protein
MRVAGRPVVVALVAGSLGFACYELWYLAQDWTKGTFLADFPFLVGLGAIILFLSIAELVLNAGWRLLGRGLGALRGPH